MLLENFTRHGNRGLETRRVFGVRRGGRGLAGEGCVTSKLVIGMSHVEEPLFVHTTPFSTRKILEKHFTLDE